MKDRLIITGASAGIGLATARHFRDGGWNVTNISRRACPVEGVDNVAADLTAVDVRDTLARALGETLANAQHICLVHNAAAMHGDSVRDLTGDALRDVLAVNVIGPQELNRLVVPHMQPGSSIVYVGSTLSEKAVAGAFSYVTSKHAVIGMMRATCQDLSGGGVHTAAVCPGFTDTEMLRGHIGDNADAMAFIQDKTGYGRLIDSVEIARVIMFVATNPVVNGAVLHANLGQIET